MPKPTLKDNDLLILLNENLNLLKKLDSKIIFKLNSNLDKIIFNSDKEQLSRVFFNLIKNSIESIHQKSEKDSNFNKNISIELNETDDHISLIIDDNGIGFKNLDANIIAIIRDEKSFIPKKTDQVKENDKNYKIGKNNKIKFVNY